MQSVDNKYIEQSGLSGNLTSPSKGKHVLEEEVKNKVSSEFFPNYDTTGIIGKIDFSVAKRKKSERGQSLLFEDENQDIQFFLWAEAKKGTKCDIYESLVQLILTIGKAKTFETYLPPLFLGALDAEKIAFIQYTSISHIFYKSDFNWNVTPSDHNSKEFRELHDIIRTQLENDSQLYFYKRDEKELRAFIANNFVLGNTEHIKIQVSKSNFTAVYLKWLKEVKPTIDIDWDLAKKRGIIDADFFLADLLSENNASLKDSLFVLLHSNIYTIVRENKDELGLKTIQSVNFKDGQKSHKAFWGKYKRPPRKDFWQYIVERRDLLVPQDVRERKGSYFTPQIWVEKSHEYLTQFLGENWQDEYIIWDCCAGTGNMERGLINPYNVFASTLDKADVDVIRDQIRNGMNLLESHVFQFDFLNDEFDSDKIPSALKKIIFDKEKRKKLLMYINPPYAEATNTKTIPTGDNKHKAGVAQHATYEKFKDKLGRGINEIFAHFLMRIYEELSGCWIGQFSTLKHLQSENFKPFRECFRAKVATSFIVPANTFDNVQGSFPIGFFIWNTAEEEVFTKTVSDLYDCKGEFMGTKKIWTLPERGVIMKWIQRFYDKGGERIAYMVRGAADFQNNRIVFITQGPSEAVVKHSQTHNITRNNITENGVYFAIRHCIDSDWSNDRDQFVNPETDSWATDFEFQSNCLVFSLFHNQNTIKSADGVNHWIPFKETEVMPRDRYESHVIVNHLSGLTLSRDAQMVMDAARELYRYYHKQTESNPNASYYDIREFFQGRNSNGKMNNKSNDEEYTRLMNILQEEHAKLGKIIALKVYEHGFLLN